LFPRSCRGLALKVTSRRGVFVFGLAFQVLWKSSLLVAPGNIVVIIIIAVMLPLVFARQRTIYEAVAARHYCCCEAGGQRGIGLAWVHALKLKRDQVTSSSTSRGTKIKLDHKLLLMKVRIFLITISFSLIEFYLFSQLLASAT